MVKKQVEINIKLKISEKFEQHLTYLEEVSKRPRGFIVKEALIRYLEDAEDMSRANEIERERGNESYATEEILEELNLKENKKGVKEKITVELPKSWASHLEHLEKTTKKSKDYYIREALYRHLEDLEDYQIGLNVLKSKTLSKTITDEELVKKLNL